MATITPKSKNGKIVAYKFKACVGRTDDGKQILRYATWHVPDGLIPSRARKAAERAAAQWEREARTEYELDFKQPERVREREIDSKRTEFAQFVNDVWFPLCINDGEHKQSTVEFYRATLKRIIEHFKGKYIQEITSTDIQKFLIYLRMTCRTQRGNPISDKTVRHSYCILVLIFNYAEDEEYISKNPMRKIDCPKLTKKKVCALKPDEAKKFFALLPQQPADFKCMLYLLITSGLRRGELLGLQWHDIDFNRCTIDISRNITYTKENGLKVETPKTDESMRTIPIIPFVAEELKRYRAAEHPNAKENSFIFPSPKGEDVPRALSNITHRVRRFMLSHDLSCPRRQQWHYADNRDISGIGASAGKWQLLPCGFFRSAPASVPEPEWMLSSLPHLQWVNILTEWTIYHVAELTKADRRRCLGDTEQPAEKAQR